MAASLVPGSALLVPTPGTPVNVPVPITIPGLGGPGGLTTVHAFLIQALSGNVGKIYIGVAGLVRSPLANALVVLPVPAANFIPTFSVSLTAAANALSLADLWIDADTANDGVLVSGILA